MQRLETLPSHLVEALFRTSRAPLSYQLSVVPEPLFKQAILASFPSITRDQKIVLEGSVEGRWLSSHGCACLFRGLGACIAIQDLTIDCWFLKTALSEPLALEALSHCITSLQRLKVLRLRRFFYSVPDLSCPAPQRLLASIASLSSCLRTLEIRHANYTQAYISGALFKLTGLQHLSLRYSTETIGGGEMHQHTPIAIGHLRSLTHLDLHGCALPVPRRSSGANTGARPQQGEDSLQRNVLGLRNLTSLQHLELVRCALSRAPSGSVAETLTTIPTLTHLNLSGNGLITNDLRRLFIPPRRNLASCCVSENDFSLDSFLIAVPVLSGLRHLDIAKLSVLGMSSTPQELGKLTRMRNLASLRIPVGASLPDGGLVPQLASVIQVLTGLTSLDLEGSLNDMMLLTLAPALQRLTGLQSLSLDASNYFLDEAAMQYREGLRTYHPIHQALSGTKVLRDLSLAAGQWTFALQRSLDGLAAGLSQQPYLTQIHLKFTTHFANRSAFKVLRELVHVPRLQHLRVQSTGTGVVDVESFISEVQNLTNLQLLELRGAMDCTYYSCSNLMALGRLQKLRLLDVSDCRAGSEFALSLAGCLANIPTIEKVDISGNELSYSDVLALATMMEAQPRAEVLDVAGSSQLLPMECAQLTQSFPFINW
jgi:hypothetical protein